MDMLIGLDTCKLFTSQDEKESVLRLLLLI
jgi:hypothetical protein